MKYHSIGEEWTIYNNQVTQGEQVKFTLKKPQLIVLLIPEYDSITSIRQEYLSGGKLRDSNQPWLCLQSFQAEE